MLIQLILVMLVCDKCNLQEHKKVEKRIVGGYFCGTGLGQYGIALTSFWGMPICSASILSPRWLLTAAHCKSPYTIYYASPAYLRDKYIDTDGWLSWSCPVVSVESVYLHPKYDRRYLTNDIALMKLSKPFMESPRVQYIKLDLANNKQLADSCDKATAVGFGLIRKLSMVAANPMKVRCLEIGILKTSVCQEKIHEKYAKELDHKLCVDSTSQKDICFGDSGGPLICQDEQIGISSYGTDNNCASGNPAVFTRVDKYLDFINQTINGGYSLGCSKCLLILNVWILLINFGFTYPFF